ncbi:MAG: DUF3299 domain-containing protein [Vicinamibacteria bacterium]
MRRLVLLVAVGAGAYFLGLRLWPAEAQPARRVVAPQGAPLAAPPAAAPAAPASPGPAEAPRRGPRAGEWVTETIKILASDDPDVDRYERLTFERLSDFEYDPPAGWDVADASRSPARRQQLVVPARIRRLSGRRVAIEGFMMPLDFDRGQLSNFVLNGSYDMCAFGMVPTSLNQWIDVRMSDKRKTRFTGHYPVTVFGILDVGPLWERGRVVSLYRLEADFLGIDESWFGD